MRPGNYIVCFITLFYYPLVFAGDEKCEEENSSDIPLWISHGGVVLHIIALLISFWGLAVVCEEYFVPALNILCDDYKIPDDVAGATLMAAGNSSPEFFSVIISLFITHTTLGVGTAIGSAIFNHLCICGGSVLYAKDGTLPLDWRILIRETVFYLFSLVVLVWALKGSFIQSVVNITETAEGCLKVTDRHAMFLLAMYFVYVIVCAYYKDMLRLISCTNRAPKKDCSVRSSLEMNLYYIIYAYTVPFYLSVDLHIHHLQDHAKSPLLPAHASSAGGSEYDDEVCSLPPRQPYYESALDVEEIRNAMVGGRQVSVVYLDEADETTMHPPPSEVTTRLRNPRQSEGDVIFKCWMYKRSRFYSRIRVLTSQKWQLRLFVLDGYGLRYARSDDFSSHATVKCVNIFEAISVDIIDEHDFILAVRCTSQTFKFRCLHRDDFIGMYESLRRVVNSLNDLSPEARRAKEIMSLRALQASGIVLREEDAERNLLTVPASPLGKFVHCILWPLKVALYYTIPSVNSSGERAVRYNVICIMCTLWLALLSFLMNYCMETIGEVVGLSAGVMGLTFGAAGTSFPNMLSSMLVAKLGQGNMAVSNAFGSNVFCVFMGLGFPWTLYVLVHQHAYEGLKDDGIVMSVMSLIIVLILFLILMCATRFVLYKWMGYFFILLYGIFVAYSIIQSVL